MADLSETQAPSNLTVINSRFSNDSGESNVEATSQRDDKKWGKKTISISVI
ncbi:hypothetical protein LFUMFP_170067 [Latilactobacillus fuchuensis]|uniref:Uncharacterized protein n=1 Tax=Latilactobacillus fuchuensis TaxID=164393 RepID=A0A2N9DU90_9LACO|nr:hypothetical protein LFUMFP_170067 [Latilactobacillus fuchuensis]